jgi:hypothetical protein
MGHTLANLTIQPYPSSHMTSRREIKEYHNTVKKKRKSRCSWMFLPKSAKVGAQIELAKSETKQ